MMKKEVRMKLSCLQENLNWGLGVAGRAIAAKPTLPITNNILLVADQSRLRLTGTNIEVTISCWISAKVEEEGATTLPAKLFTRFVGSLPNDEIKVSPATATALELRCAKFKARINGVGAKDFPTIPTVEEGTTIEVEAEALRKGISYVFFATATDVARPVLSGVSATFEGNLLTLAGADGYRLAEYKLPTITEVSERVEVIIPARTLAELNQLLASQEEVIEITVNTKKGQMLFRFGNVEVISQLLQGTFPDYAKVIPKEYTTQATVSVAEFLRAVKTASFFADDTETSIVSLAIASGKVVASAQSKQAGDDVSEVDAKVEGDGAEISFNSKYLVDVLSVLGEEQATLQVTTPASPAVIRGAGMDDYTYVLMPIYKPKQEA